MSYKLRKFVLLLGDLVIFNISLFLTLFVRYRIISHQGDLNSYWQSHWPYFWPVFLLFLLVIAANSLYGLRLSSASRQFKQRAISSFLVASLLSVLYFYIYPRGDISPKTNLILFSFISLLLFLLWRSLAHYLLSSSAWRDKLAIIGYDLKIAQLIDELKRRPNLGYQTALVYKDKNELENLEAQVKEHKIRAIVIADNVEQDKDLNEKLFKLLHYKVSFISYADFYEQLFEKVALESINNDWFLSNLQEGSKDYFDSIKRVADLFMAIIIFLLSSPFWPFIAILVKLSSKGPVFFRQKRIGKEGQIFPLYKFRSMREENNDKRMTEKNDSRITPIGKFLRATRFDELPQLINVIKGQMSFIGPRPERPDFSQKLEEQVPFYAMRLLVKPGLTGWDQVSGEYHSPSTEDTMKKLQNDLYYIKRRSFYLDAAIFLRTLATVISGGGR